MRLLALGCVPPRRPAWKVRTGFRHLASRKHSLRETSRTPARCCPVLHLAEILKSSRNENLAVAKLRGSTGFRLSALRMACNSVRHAPLITGLIAYIRSVGAEKPHSLTCDCYGKNNAQGHYFCGADFGARSRFGSLANGTSRCRSPRRQRLRNDLAVAHSSLRQQSSLACSLVL